MAVVRMKDKGQVTIPAAIRNQIAAQTGDVFEADVLDGNIILRPQDIVSRRAPKKISRKGADITRWIGAGKGLFKTPEEADAFIHAERARWD